jgi:Bacteriocin-protection, YdeI or OmpD-Associated/Domain of unknown function (DUF1905)
MSFRTTILRSGKTATGIEVPAEVVAGLGSSKKPAVRVTINGFTYRSTVAVMGGVFMLPVSAQVRESAGVAGGDVVDIDVELDTQARDVTLPTDFSAALDHDPQARRFFDGLSFSQKQALVISVEGAKTAETRQRRIDKALAALREGRAR